MLKHIMAYIDDNLLCLFYGIELLATKYAIFASYHDLLSDIADSYGVYTALVVLTISGTLLLVIVQETSYYAINALCPSVIVKFNKFTNTLAYAKLRLTHFFFNFFK